MSIPDHDRHQLFIISYPLAGKALNLFNNISTNNSDSPQLLTETQELIDALTTMRSLIKRNIDAKPASE